MTKIIAAFDNLEEAQAAAKRLAATGVAQNQISIICNGGRPSRAKSELKKSLAWGGALGAGLALLLPHGGVFYLAGRMARSAALHVLGVTVKGMLAGAATGGAFDLLRSAGPDRRAAREAAEIIAAGRFALALDGDWVTAQRARAAIGAERAQTDEYLVEMVNRYGYEYQSFALLYGGMEVWRSQKPEAAVIYRRVGRVAVVGAAPLTAREHMRESSGGFSLTAVS